MKKITVVLSAIVVALGAWAGVPVKWTVETSRADVQEVPCYHGETLEMEATLKNYGKDLLMPTNLDAQIFWQTNGMSVFYWRTNNVTIVSNKLVATFTPEMDPGTSSCKGFIGVPGEIYRASFVLRFKNSPGLEPRSMEWPYRELDFNQVEMKNEKWYRKEVSDAKYETAESVSSKYIAKTNANGTCWADWDGNEFKFGSQNLWSGLSIYVDGVYTKMKVKTVHVPAEITLPMSSGTLARLEDIPTSANLVPWIKDKNGQYTAVTIGERYSDGSPGYQIGEGSLYVSDSKGRSNGKYSIASGERVNAWDDYSIALGRCSETRWQDKYAFCWSGMWGSGKNESKGEGTFNIYPKGGMNGFYIQGTNLTTILSRYATGGNPGTSTNAVEALIKAYDNTNITARIGAATSVATTAQNKANEVESKANATSNKVEFIEGYMAGQRVRVSVTNYYGNTSGALPRLRIEEYVTATNTIGGVTTETNYWTTVWDENNKYNEWLTEARSAIAAMTNNLYQTYYQLLQTRLATKAPKAWGTVTSAGEAAPPGTVWNTEPTTVFAGGTEYAHAMVGSGVIGVLTAKGASIYTAGATGKFRFTTDDEASYFGMDIANRYELGCATDGIEVTLVGGNNLVELTYNVTMTGKPILYYRRTLASTNTWEQITNSSGEPVSGASVYASWEQNPPSGTEICTINGGANLTGFFMATIEYPSSAKFETNMPSDLKGGILATNQTQNVIQPVEPYISNGSVLWRIKQ